MVAVKKEFMPSMKRAHAPAIVRAPTIFIIIIFSPMEHWERASWNGTARTHTNGSHSQHTAHKTILLALIVSGNISFECNVYYLLLTRNYISFKNQWLWIIENATKHRPRMPDVKWTLIKWHDDGRRDVCLRSSALCLWLSLAIRKLIQNRFGSFSGRSHSYVRAHNRSSSLIFVSRRLLNATRRA